MSLRPERYRCVLMAGVMVGCALSGCGESEDSDSGGSGGAANGGTSGDHGGGTSGDDSGGTNGIDSGGTNGADTGGSAGADTSGTGGADTGSSAGAAGSAGASNGDCPLDENQRALAVTEFQRTTAEASWILTQTHGSGEFASRAFGFALPFTTTGALAAATLAQACEGEMEFDEYCTTPEEVQQGPGNCSQLHCLSSGVLQATTRIHPLPAVAAAEPPPGEVEFEQAHQIVTFTEAEDGGITVEWTTEFELTLPDGTALMLSESAEALVGEDGPERNAGQITIEGLSSEPLVIDYATDAGETTGAGTVSGEQVLEVTHDGIVWMSACEL